MSNRTLHQRKKRSNNEWQRGMLKKLALQNLNAQVTLTSSKKTPEKQKQTKAGSQNQKIQHESAS